MSGEPDGLTVEVGRFKRLVSAHHRYTAPWSSALITLARVGEPVEALWAIHVKLAGVKSPADRQR
ncbi:MAG: hypothetical protein Q7J56_01885 [Deltaproteobacteria bacterium]|nr:hypothetical protein [Deltaproteobacteria bacterium]